MQEAAPTGDEFATCMMRVLAKWQRLIQRSAHALLSGGDAALIGYLVDTSNTTTHRVVSNLVCSQ
jgi:hypothetical protein